MMVWFLIIRVKFFETWSANVLSSVIIDKVIRDFRMVNLLKEYSHFISHDSSVGELMHLSHCLFSPWPGFNSQPLRRISQDFSLADHTHLERR